MRANFQSPIQRVGWVAPMLSFLLNTAKLAVEVATLPVSVAADIVTIGGELTDRKEMYTESNVYSIAAQAEKTLDDITG